MSRHHTLRGYENEMHRDVRNSLGEDVLMGPTVGGQFDDADVRQAAALAAQERIELEENINKSPPALSSSSPHPKRKLPFHSYRVHPQTDTSVSIPMETLPPAPDSITHATHALEQVPQLRDSIARIEEATLHIHALYRKDAMEGKTSPSQETHASIEHQVQTINDTIRHTRTRIMEMTRYTQDPPLPQALYHSLKHHQSTLARRLLEATQALQQVHTDAKKMYTENIKRQYKIAQPFATDAEVERIVEQGSIMGGTSGFQQDVITSQEKRKALQHVQARLDDLGSIEQSIVQLYDMMQDMKMILETQQVNINVIETHVEQTAHQAQDASHQLTKATESAQSARKKKWILVAIVLVILAIFAIIVAIYWKQISQALGITSE